MDLIQASQQCKYPAGVASGNNASCRLVGEGLIQVCPGGLVWLPKPMSAHKLRRCPASQQYNSVEMKKMNVADAGLDTIPIVGLCYSVKEHNLGDLGVPDLQVMVCGLHSCNVDKWEGKAIPEEIGF